jgi:eukaryotic-like serine/threonine-protein kinase
MNYKEDAIGVASISGRLWRFADYEFDELARELRVKGRAVELESKPLDVLLQLLLHAGEVVTKEELLESVWPNVMVVDGSLATAVSKLRRALGDEHQPAILTVPRVGYRLAVPVYCKTIAAAGSDLGFKAGELVPGREQWRLSRPMDVSGSSEVWLAENPKTHEQRVFKFAGDGLRLQSLKREITISRFLRESLGDRPEFIRILEWNFETPPFFLESEYAGPNLAEWAGAQGGLGKIPLDIRLHLLVDIAQAVAAAHGIGVLHKDLKPANILIVHGVVVQDGAVPGAGGSRQIKIADFGSASLFDPSRLHALGITNLGFTQTAGLENDALTGTLMYLAPEVLAGQSPSAAADVYALGVMLYQLIIGDFRKPLAPGWETEIQDPLLREDIADAACGEPAKRLSSAADLVERLLTIEQRRIRRDELETARLRAQVAERKLAEARARRPWAVLAVIALAAGLGLSFTLYRKAVRERDIAHRQTAIASSINRFLSDDLLGRANPFSSGKSSESLMEAIKQASSSIDRQFNDEPLVAARLHQTIARALDNRTDYPDARQEYGRAAALFKQVDGDLSQDAIIVQLQRTTLEARSYENGSLPLAKSILAQQQALIAKLPHTQPELGVWLSSAQGMVALIENNAKSAAENFQAAVNKAEALPEFDDSARLTFKQRLAFSYIRMGEGAKAEQLFRALIDAFTRVAGADSPHVLRVRLNLAQAFMIQNKHAEAIKEANAIYPEFVSRLGADHELTMQLLSTRAQSEGSLELWDDAIRDDLAIHELAVRKQGPLSFFAVATLTDASQAQCRSGRNREGESNARNAYEASTKAFGPRAALTGATAYTLASCLISFGKLDEPSKLLPQIDVPLVAQLTGDPDWGANVTLAEAEIAYRRGNNEAARVSIQTVAPVFTRKTAEPYQQRAFESLRGALEKASPRN